MTRDRFVYFVVGCVVVALGLASRRYGAVLPVFIGRYAGDTLYATMMFVSVGFIATQWSSLRVAGAALLLSYAVEVSQLYHAPWIEMLRHTWVGGLVLGYGFLWSDIVCYTVGVAFGVVFEIGLWEAVRWRREASLV